MINSIVRLTQPKRFEIFLQQRDFSNDLVVVRPTYMSICQADQRYYNGLRSHEVLQQKLPMSLIHEAIGEVVFDPKKEFRIGDRVVIIPNIPGYVLGQTKSKSCLDEMIGENYCADGYFRSSSYDGFMQELVFQPREMLIHVPSKIPNELAAFIELMSVAMHSIRRFNTFSNRFKDSIGIWGDGNLGFITALLIKAIYPNSQIFVFGKHPEKLQMFSFVEGTILIAEDIRNFKIDHAFECVGGIGSQKAIKQIIEVINPGGTINLLGVSEEPIAINTRLILEKGLTLIGQSRSGKPDYEELIRLLNNNKLEQQLSILVSNITKVSNLEDITRVFEIDKIKVFGKTIIEWNF